jgi:predicted RNA-binding Zn-ribbon protein involved in translation (DUF1610 family)
MHAWSQGRIDCTNCDGEATAQTDQWGRTTHFECPDCGCEIDREDGRR